ncbi:MAG: hypothetical protein QOH84_5243 [Kribbellaceae bacterium]|jgi:hypothetical protein|nr:hypothetical protein [Kribbellaceae bacterium]
MEKSPENKEAPSRAELKPQEKAANKVERALGKAAIKGVNGGK